jgi:hypothetical protein
MVMAINAMLTELTEEEGSNVQGGAFFFNIPYFSPSTATGAPATTSFTAQRDPLNYGFVALFDAFGSTKVTGLALSIPGTTAPISPVNLNPTTANAALLQFLFTA